MKIYDFIAIGWWAAWLFATINAPKGFSKIILEKSTKTMWVKVLLSWGERANASNMDIEPTRDYFGQNRKAMIWIYNAFTNWDIMWWFAENWIVVVEEDRWRLILESWDSRELLNILVKKSRENNTEHMLWCEVLEITKDGDNFLLKTNQWEFLARNVLVSSGWRSFMHVWTVWDSYKFAEGFWIDVVRPHRWLSGLVTREDLKEVSGVSTRVSLEVVSRGEKKPIYTEVWPILFTHFGVSGPIIHNSGVALGEYLNKKNIKDEEEFLRENVNLKVTFNLDGLPKSLIRFFELTEEDRERDLNVIDYRSWKEAKVTWGWISLNELTNKLESKKVPWLYFAGEALDLTWKTWGFNLQQAWSSGALVWKSIK